MIRGRVIILKRRSSRLEKIVGGAIGGAPRETEPVKR